MDEQRNDARRHRRALLDAGSEVFLVHGITAPLDLVVERAGVGRATLYRHFPDRAALVLALIDESLDALDAVKDAVPPGQSAFCMLLDHLAGILAEDPSLADFWRVVPLDSANWAPRLERLHGIFKEPVRTAIDEGLLRADFQIADVSLVTAMLGVVVRETVAINRKSMVDRLLDLMMSGLLLSKNDYQV